MPKRISAADKTPIRVVIVTMDSHLASAASRARATLCAELPGLDLAIHAADEWSCNPAALEHCREDIARGHIIVATMLFLDEHIQAVMPALAARRDLVVANVQLAQAAQAAPSQETRPLVAQGVVGKVQPDQSLQPG